MIRLRAALRVAAVAVAIAVIVVGCEKMPMKEARAIEVARRTVGAEAVVIRTAHGTFQDLVPDDHHGIAPLRPVWVLTFGQATGGDCAESTDGQSTCPDGPRATVVVLDDVTGELLFSESPAPS